MKKRKKKRPSTQEERLKHAAKWVHTYSGKLIIRRYNKKYGISLKDCVKELGILGLPISMRDLREYRKLQRQQRENKRAKKQLALLPRTQLFRDTEEMSFYAEDYHVFNCAPKAKAAVRNINNLSYVSRKRLYDSLAIFPVDDDELPF